MSALTGLLVGSVLMVLEVDLALAFGLFAFLLHFIPSVGSILVTLLPLPVVLVSPDLSMSNAVLAIALPATIQFVLGNIVEPKIMGESLDLHPVVILLATPLTAIMKILCERMELITPGGRVTRRPP